LRAGAPSRATADYGFIRDLGFSNAVDNGVLFIAAVCYFRRMILLRGALRFRLAHGLYLLTFILC
jgi:hypothetical protein